MFRPSSSFDKLLEKATSNLLLEPDWNSTLQICDCIRQGDCQPKYAIAAVKKKLYHSNPHVAMYALLVLESCVKNCGSLIHEEVATKVFMEELREIVKTTSHENFRNKVLELIQCWAQAFRNTPKYRVVGDILQIMKAEGYQFPSLKESDAMFSVDKAPEWADGECCHRCRVQFGVVQRKHHCRACGQVFCGKCSSKYCTLPKFGIEKEVRVCEACYEKVNKAVGGGNPQKVDTAGSDLPLEYLGSSLSQQSQQAPQKKCKEELQEEEELLLALALSKSEAEEKEKQKLRATSSILSGVNKTRTHSPPPPVKPDVNQEEEVDPELARYLNRSYWEQQQRRQQEEGDKKVGNPVVVAEQIISAQPSAPTSAQTTSSATTLSPVSSLSVGLTSLRVMEKYQNGETDEIQEFVSTLKSQVEIFVNRMKSNSSRGRSISNDSSVQTLFMNITAMHSQLLKYIQLQDDKRVYYEGLQDKLTQVKDARAALDALREEHREKLRREAEEAERIRQIQMAEKLEIMRKKKQEYLQYQRQLAMQRMQEQERQMQMRQEQQKQQYIMGQMTGPCGVYQAQQGPFIPPPGPPQGYNPAITEGSPAHVTYQHPGPSAGASMPSGAPPPSGSHFPPQGAPASGIPATTQPSYPGGLPSGEFQPYNMQAMTNALPNLQEGPPGAPYQHQQRSQQQPSGPAGPYQQQQPPTQPAGPPGGQQQPSGPAGPYQQQQPAVPPAGAHSNQQVLPPDGPPHPPAEEPVAELISFD